MKVLVDVDGPDADGYVWMGTGLGGHRAQVNLGHHCEEPAATILRTLGIADPAGPPDDAQHHVNCQGENDGRQP